MIEISKSSGLSQSLLEITLSKNLNHKKYYFLKNIKTSKSCSVRNDRIFGNNDRITFRIEEEYFLDTESETQRNIDYFLRLKDYKLIDYKKGLCSKDNREFKIVKVLKREYKNIFKIETIIKEFINDPSRSNSKDDLYITVSRNPYDVITMSTFKGWTSCMNLDTGQYAYKLSNDLKYGTLICYIHKTKDLDVDNSTGRFLLKPFRIKNKKSTIYYINETKHYGSIGNLDIGKLGEDISKYVNSDTDIMDKTKLISYKNLYLDSLSRETVFRKKEWDFNNIDDVKLYDPCLTTSNDKLKELLLKVSNKGILFHSANLNLVRFYRIHIGNIFTDEVISYIKNNMNYYSIIKEYCSYNFDLITDDLNLILKYLSKKEIEKFCGEFFGFLTDRNPLLNFEYEIPDYIKKIIELNSTNFQEGNLSYQLSKQEFNFIRKYKNGISYNSVLMYNTLSYMIKNRIMHCHLDWLFGTNIQILKQIEKESSYSDMEFLIASCESIKTFSRYENLILLLKYSYIPKVRIELEKHKYHTNKIVYTVEQKPLTISNKIIHSIKYKTILRHIFS